MQNTATIICCFYVLRDAAKQNIIAQCDTVVPQIVKTLNIEQQRNYEHQATDK